MIIIIPPIFNKYNVAIQNQHSIIPEVTYYYADLNSDGRSEEIEFRQIRENYLGVTVREKEKVINEWNFEGKFIKSKNTLIAKADNDSISSIYFLSFENNKLFLNCLNPFENKILFKKKFIADFTPIDKNNPDIILNSGISTNQNKKGIKELYFSLNATYSKQPRGVYKYNPSSDSIYSSDVSYAAIPQPMLVDTSASEMKLLFASSAYENSDYNDRYSDHYAWLMSYNINLKLKERPIQIGVHPSESNLVTISHGKKNYYVCLNIYTGINNLPSTLTLFNSDLEAVKKIEFSNVPECKEASLYVNKDEPQYFYLIKVNGVIEKYDFDLKIIWKDLLPAFFTTMFFNGDLDGDNKSELIFVGSNMDEFIFARSDFSDYLTFRYPGAYRFWNYSVKQLDKYNFQLIVFSNDASLTFSYKFNQVYYLKYLFYAGIYVLVLALILLIQKSQRHRAELKYIAERRIAELQLKSVKNQIDPHFTLNIVNSIGSLFYKQDREKADYIFGKYSKLLRSTVLNSDKIITTLKEELEYVENYMELEKFRSNNKFSWKVEVKENLNIDIKIPKMLIHTFVENAIKHGLKHLDKKGKLVISITQDSKDYIVTIYDNGVGRKKANEVEYENTGKGLNIIDQILSLYYELTKTKISYQIEDLIDDNLNSLGTKVLINIPVE